MARELGERCVETAFDIVGEPNVGHRSAGLAGQVVMVADECLGQLEAGKVADPGQASDHTFGFEHGEIAVDAARSLPRGPVDDLVDSERPARLGERLDQVAPSTRVAAVVTSETRGDILVEVRRHCLSIPT